jgi:hypothetical protein
MAIPTVVAWGFIAIIITALVIAGVCLWCHVENDHDRRRTYRGSYADDR